MPNLSRTTRLCLVLVINLAFFFVEIVAGYSVHSLALVADSFHMLNDVLSLAVALWAITLAEKKDHGPKYTYGWQRAEVLGALINGVFLVALCFSIAIEAIQRFVEPQDITNPKIVLIVGCAGLAGNILGLFLFHEHSHSHSHGHSHDHQSVNMVEHSDHEHSHHSHHNIDAFTLDIPQPSEFTHGDSHSLEGVTKDITSKHFNRHAQRLEDQSPAHANLNMRGVFLHVMGDALGNVGVIATALFIWLTPFSWRFYLDPVVSLVITIIIFHSALPLVREASIILLQGSPKSIQVENIRGEIKNLDHVLSVHELHIWQLSDTKFIASVHVRLEQGANYMGINGKIREVMHRNGIHSATIQPEFIDSNNAFRTIEGEEKNDEITASDSEDNEYSCLLRCQDTTCEQNLCCPPVKGQSNV